MNKKAIRAGICLFGLSGLDPDTACHLASLAGIRPVSMGMEAVRHDVSDFDALCRDPVRHGAVMRTRLDKYGLEAIELFMCAVPHGNGVTPTEPDAEARTGALELFRCLCAYAASAGFTHVMGVPGPEAQGEDKVAAWGRACEMLATMLRTAKEEGIGFTVEPHRGSLLSQPADALRMVREVPGLAYTLDYSHFHAQGFLPEEVAPLHPYAVHMHIKQARPGVPKTLWHEGLIPYAKIIGQLAGAAWQGVLSSEYIGPMPLKGPSEESRPDNPLVQNLEVIRWITTTLHRYADISLDTHTRIH